VQFPGSDGDQQATRSEPVGRPIERSGPGEVGVGGFTLARRGRPSSTGGRNPSNSGVPASRLRRHRNRVRRREHGWRFDGGRDSFPFAKAATRNAMVEILLCSGPAGSCFVSLP
jgi:hypothetical protein